MEGGGPNRSQERGGIWERYRGEVCRFPNLVRTSMAPYNMQSALGLKCFFGLAPKKILCQPWTHNADVAELVGL